MKKNQKEKSSSLHLCPVAADRRPKFDKLAALQTLPNYSRPSWFSSRADATWVTLTRPIQAWPVKHEPVKGRSPPAAILQYQTQAGPGKNEPVKGRSPPSAILLWLKRA
ncbi:MAG: hypothetical protein A2509_04205 [Candidatus Edwardsbacteria bacterium RIFOXYD12_FULL_50_11]|uniref:Uncharacterized protein n=1 Tax=Candidatus Edwardsbacteria bacterium GWF2_54_11 TaxID=1817851 RepID=A0A1F5RG86_9BACT|nr:MAG: hypothetical protein A2502_05410 [Candidatus Edwardsbacteria bacterium RifOxyC12_full_54_24]OGF07891.1 MAG: hypothetical protein A2273_05365 [Candidatus Edwardsbacteria bacterium RifOxyA12_full_54_48]OGF10139.1 MAG: hypothetical protein A3K15_11780 [Candidatus Edwardsbacteria bacterium GWE2_54_12]OGF13081.1 MAG: hypothetical protein A2024_04695 [Candidatus Edwardsbacteria bacterium GWF2_54_11]OGF15051.1 MAG: hypothetical protein A2509_04205 [Candidatus Edwardsbacteria bacterium RIFOXYD1